MARNGSRWCILAVICLFAFYCSVTLQSIAPILSLMIEDLGVSHAQLGLFVSVFTLPGIFLIIPLSLMSHRFSIKRLGIISLLLILLGLTLIVLSKSFNMLLLGRILAGLGSVVVPVVGLQGVARWFSGYRLGLAMGFYSSMLPLGAIIAFNTFSAAGIVWGWRSTMLIPVIVGVITLVVFTLFFRDPPDQPEARGPMRMPSFNSIFKIGWPIWLLSICWGFFNIGFMALTTFLPDFMYQNGVELEIAGSVASIIMVCGLFLGIFTGYLLDRTKSKVLYITVGALFSAVFVLLLPANINLTVLFVVMIGIFTAPLAPTVFAIAPSLVRRDMMALAYGLIATMSYLGMFAGPYISGFILDVTRSYLYSYWFIAAVFLLVSAFSTILLVSKYKSNMPSQPSTMG